MIVIIIGEYGIYKNKIKKVSELTNGSNYKVQVQCPLCKDIRWAFYFKLIVNGHHYCRPCALKIKLSKTLEIGKKYGRLTVLNPSDTGGKSICKCECGIIKEYDNYSLSSGSTRSCGCLKKENFKNVPKPVGEQHGNWKGGISSDRQRVMSTKKYKDWRNNVFERDNYTCVKCGQIGGTLNAHHIENYADCKEKRMELDNGITLCKNCHVEFHKIYGKSETNGEMIKEFCELKDKEVLQ